MISNLLHFFGLCPCSLTHPDLLDVFLLFPFLFFGLKTYFETWYKK